MRCTTRKQVSLVVLLLGFGQIALAESCLREAEAFAKEVCGDTLLQGQSSSMNVTGDLTGLESNVLLKKILGANNVDGNAKYVKEEYIGVLIEHLAEESRNARKCRMEMAILAVNEACANSSTRAK